ncbi:MAG: Tol-Pal system beta propeller repeat protein TolB [Candidatus Aminicenantes bacterium]|nr:Tol-Pal system beta propeller repeat protein TolB [Candidatus Aminicenantes bacterium]
MKLKKTWTFGSMILAATALLAPQQEFKMVIRDGMPAISFALPKFSVAAPPLQTAADEIYQVLSDDLKYSRIFQLLPKSYYDYIRPLDPKSVQFKDWESIQANLLFTGEVADVEGGETAFIRNLYDVKSQRPILNPKRYQAKKPDLRFLAHRMADEIMKAYGEKPVFESKIAFVSDRDGNLELYMMDYDGANQTRLTFNKVNDISPAWSPDGKMIATTSYQNLTAGLYILQIYEGRRIAVASRGGNFSPCWSPDGKKLAFMSTMDGNAEIYVADIDDDALKRGAFRIKRLTFNQGTDTAPSWSPTGRQLTFVSDRGGTAQIYTMDAEGSNVVRVSFGGSTHHDSPAWSPAGDRIVYVARVDNIFDLYVLDLRSQQISKLTESKTMNESPSWSPDGRHIVFKSNMKGGLQLFTIDYDGAGLRQLTFKGQNTWPDWSY